MWEFIEARTWSLSIRKCLAKMTHKGRTIDPQKELSYRGHPDVSYLPASVLVISRVFTHTKKARRKVCAREKHRD